MATATHRLWARLAHPFDHLRTVEALMGLSHGAAQLLQAALLTTSPEADDLLAALPRISRSMAIATTDTPVRTIGQIRGPILWSETMAARASSFGDEGVFVCSATERAYDTAENRVLAAALQMLVDSSRTVESQRSRDQESNLVAGRARAVGTLATRHLEHRTLSGVPRRRPTGRDLRRTRAGHRYRTYRPALDLIDRATVPFHPDELVLVADAHTKLLHEVLDQALRSAEQAGVVVVGPLREHEGALRADRVSFRHPLTRGSEHPSGILIDDLLLVVPRPDTESLDDSGGSSAGSPLARQAVAGYEAVRVRSTEEAHRAVTEHVSG